MQAIVQSSQNISNDVLDELKMGLTQVVHVEIPTELHEIC